MWNRQRLKRNARVLLKANYLKVVVVGLILSFLIGSGYNSARGAAKSNDVDIDVKIYSVGIWHLLLQCLLASQA